MTDENGYKNAVEYVDTLTSQLKKSVLDSNIYKQASEYIPDDLVKNRIDRQINDSICDALRPSWLKNNYNVSSVEMNRILLSKFVDELKANQALREQYKGDDDEFYSKLASKYKLLYIPDVAKPAIEKIMQINAGKQMTQSTNKPEGVVLAVADSNNQLVVDQIFKELGMKKPAILNKHENIAVDTPPTTPTLVASSTSSRGQRLP